MCRSISNHQVYLVYNRPVHVVLQQSREKVKTGSVENEAFTYSSTVHIAIEFLAFSNIRVPHPAYCLSTRMYKRLNKSDLRSRLGFKQHSDILTETSFPHLRIFMHLQKSQHFFNQISTIGKTNLY